MQIQVDTRDNETVYTGSQFGWYARSNKQTGDRAYLHPKHTLGETPLRWNWQTPIYLSRHHQDVLYMASNASTARSPRATTSRRCPAT